MNDDFHGAQRETWVPLLTGANEFYVSSPNLHEVRTYNRLAQMARGETPVASLAAGVSSLVGAILMLIPGYLTDACGLILFLPVIRTLAGAIILKRIAARGSFAMRGGMPFGGASSFGFQSSPAKPDHGASWPGGARSGGTRW